MKNSIKIFLIIAIIFLSSVYFLSTIVAYERQVKDLQEQVDILYLDIEFSNAYCDSISKELDSLQNRYQMFDDAPGKEFIDIINAINIINTLPYKVYAVKQFNMRDLNGKSLGISLYKENTKLEAIFKIRAGVDTDIYNLFTSDNKFYNVAAITSYKQSILLNSIFRSIKENTNLDYIEASDDEEEFENVETNKYVDLDKCVLMNCVYNKHFKKWEPVKIVNNNNIITKKQAILLEKNK